VLNAHGFVISEAEGCVAYLEDVEKIDPSFLLREVASYDTIGNAYFSYLSHIVPRNWRHVAVVTSDFHMPRSQAIWRTLQRLTRDSTSRPTFDVSFVTVSDHDALSEADQRARRAREQQSLARWEQETSLMEHLSDLCAWLHETHLCYAVKRRREFGIPSTLPDDVLRSY
jgi:hypothetical protein